MEHLSSLQKLLPGIVLNLDKMRATEWASVLKNISHIAVVIITLKTLYPRADLSKVVNARPRTLLEDPQRLEEDAKQVAVLLKDAGDQIDLIIEAVPSFLDPKALVTSLCLLKRWFPNQKPTQILIHSPQVFLNVDEADLDADPLYGRSFW